MGPHQKCDCGSNRSWQKQFHCQHKDASCSQHCNCHGFNRRNDKVSCKKSQKLPLTYVCEFVFRSHSKRLRRGNFVGKNFPPEGCVMIFNVIASAKTGIFKSIGVELCYLLFIEPLLNQWNRKIKWEEQWPHLPVTAWIHTPSNIVVSYVCLLPLCEIGSIGLYFCGVRCCETLRHCLSILLVI